MKISALITVLLKAKEHYGDIKVVGDLMDDEVTKVLVIDDHGMEIWPSDPNGVRGVNAVECVFLVG